MKLSFPRGGVSQKCRYSFWDWKLKTKIPRGQIYVSTTCCILANYKIEIWVRLSIFLCIFACKQIIPAEKTFSFELEFLSQFENIVYSTTTVQYHHALVQKLRKSMILGLKFFCSQYFCKKCENLTYFCRKWWKQETENPRQLFNINNIGLK